MGKIRNFVKTKGFVFPVLFCVLFISCDPGTGISVINNTGRQIVIECRTIYDTRSDDVEMLGGILMRSIWLDRGYFVILAGPLELKPKGVSSLIGAVGFDIVRDQLGLGTVESIDDVVYAIDQVFLELNVYIYENNEKKLLYDKSYFLDRQNIELAPRFARIGIE